VEVRKNKSTQKLELANGMRKCLYYYFYYLDKEFGFMHVKLQSWFPFKMQVYIHGREYLSKQLDLAGIPYKRYDNCFIEIADIENAQEIADAFNARSLDNMLNRFAKQINPFLSRIESIVLGNCLYIAKTERPTVFKPMLISTKYAIPVKKMQYGDCISLWMDVFYVKFSRLCFNTSGFSV
jgi:hypothetical protein